MFWCHKRPQTHISCVLSRAMILNILLLSGKMWCFLMWCAGGWVCSASDFHVDDWSSCLVDNQTSFFFVTCNHTWYQWYQPNDTRILFKKKEKKSIPLLIPWQNTFLFFLISKLDTVLLMSVEKLKFCFFNNFGTFDTIECEYHNVLNMW